MKRFALLAVAVIVFFFSVEMAFAAQIKHHGVMADPDAEAKDCLICHDGTSGKFTSVCTAQCNSSGAHSILNRYPPPGKLAEYAPASTLAFKGIKLENGAVTCISCHNLRNPAKYHLVVDNAGRKLCMICHIKK